MTANFASLEAEVDQFLSTSSSPLPSLSTLHLISDEDNPPKLPQLKPKPLTYGIDSVNNNYKLYLLLELATRRAWNDVIKLSDELLFGTTSIFQPYCTDLMNISTRTNHGTSNINKGAESVSVAEIQKNVVEIIQWRIRAMFHLRRYNDLKLCIHSMNLTCAKYSNDELPSWIPLSLILQSMECLALLSGMNKKNKQKQRIKVSDSKDADGEEKIDEKGGDDILDEFYLLRTKVSDLYAVGEKQRNDIGGKKDSLWLHLLQVDIILSNILTKNEEWRLALVTLEQIIGYAEQLAAVWAKKLLNDRRDMSGGTTGLLRNATQLMTKAILIEMFSRQGRILLQSGALPAAATIFERAHDENQEILSTGVMEKISGTEANISGDGDIVLKQKIVQNIPTQIMINEGLLHFAHMDYDLAEVKFNKAIKLQRVLKGQETPSDPEITSISDTIIETEGDLLVPCINNFALCALYTCRMREAVVLMEMLIREDPTRYLTHCIVFNLCTLYELGWDSTMSERKKRVLQMVAKRFSLHDVGAESFRLG